MQPVRVLKVDKQVDRRATLAPEQEQLREFWVEQRHALLMQLASIERLLGIDQRSCRKCGALVTTRG